MGKLEMVRSMAIGKLNDQGGFTYLAALFLIAILGAISAAVGVIWSHEQQRDKEHELMFIGKQFQTAIGQYYEKAPGTVHHYPATLEDLLKDERQLGVQRYLRKVYIDPMTHTDKWGLVMAPEGGIMGIHSLSEDSPIKTANFSGIYQSLTGKTKYSEWEFVYRPAQLNMR